MKITDIVTEAANPAQQAAIAISMKKAGKKPKQGVAEGSDRIATNKQDRLDALENKLIAKGYTRTKDPDRREYQYKWTKDGAPTYVVNYRFGSNGYAEFWKEQGMTEGSESDAYGNTGEKHECGSCDGTGIVSYDELAKAAEYDDVCPECGGKGWVRDKESLKKKGMAEAYQFKGGFPFDVDHMNGPRGINLPSAPTKKFFTDKQKWSQTVDDINSSKYNDNSEYTGVTGRSTVSINGHEWARWSDAQQKGYIELSSMSEQDMAEEASPMIKPPANRFDNKQEAFDYAKEHGGKVFKSTYIDPNTGIKNIIFVVKKEQGVAEGILGSDPNRGQKVPDWAKGGIVGKIGRHLDPAWSDVQRTVPKHLLAKQPGAAVTNAPITKDTPKSTSATPTRAIPKSTGTKPSQPVTKNVVKTIADKQGVVEGSGPKEKQKTPYRDINSPEYRAAADKQKQRMAKDKAAEPGKKLLAKKGVAEDTELAEEFDLIESIVEMIAEHNGVDAEVVWADLESLTEDELYVFAVTSDPLMEDWQKANKRDKTDGMSQKAVNAYRRENPGSKLKTAVTTKPGKLKKGGKASKRRKSYCSRSRGQMKMHSISCAKTPDKAICKARRRWNC